MAAIAGVVASVIGGLVAADTQAASAEEAARLQAGGASGASAIQNQQFQTIRNDQAPWRDAGQWGIGRLQQLMGRDVASEQARAARIAASQREEWIDPFGQSQVVWSDATNNPIANSTLYQNNPAYRQAFDQAMQEARARYSEEAMIAQGVPNQTMAEMVEQRIRQLVPSQRVIRTVDPGVDPGAAFVGPEGRGNILDQAAPQGQQGGGGQGELGSLMRMFSSQDLQNDPVYQASYQSGLDEGRKALERRFGAAGMSNSGAAIKALTRFGTDYTAQRGNEAFNRFNSQQTNQYNRLASLSGIGQTSANQTSAAAQNLGNNLAGITLGNANAQAASELAQGRVWGGTIGNLGNWWNQYQQSQQLNQQQPAMGYSAPAWTGGAGDNYTPY